MFKIILLILPFLFQLSLTGIIPKSSSNNVVSIQMNRNNYKRCGEINIGGQNVNLAFSLYGTDFWIAINKNKLNSSFKPLNIIGEIKDAGIKGPLMKSTLTIGGIKIKNMPLVVVNSIPAAYSNSLVNTNGMLGLSKSGNNNPLEYLSKNLQNPILTFYTKSNGQLSLPSQNEKSVGLITFGGEDNENCVEYSYAPLAEKSKWSVDIQCIKVGEKELSSVGSKTMQILEEELLMLAPQNVLEEIAKIMNLTSFGDDTGMFVFKKEFCNEKNIDKLPKITLIVGDPNDCDKQAIIEINPKQYLQFTSLGDCRLLIANSVAMGYDNNWLMGAKCL
uniref:Peptidase A1 domain-containing protein n=1 Tax=Meloidogyne hapla TaxID=6305 RepID=A0A1I8BET8_MELHA